MQVGIIGLPNVGKSTIFNTLTKAEAEVANYPFCTIEPNVGIINVPDANLSGLSKIYNSPKITPATIGVMDVAGLVRGASRGEGLGNKFLSHIRAVDIVTHIVRCFYDENVSHVKEDINPADDIDIINTELLLSDIEILQRRRERLLSAAKSGDSKAKSELDLVDSLIGRFNQEKFLDLKELEERQSGPIRDLNLLSIKPTLYVANMGEDEAGKNLYRRLVEKVGEESVIKIYAKLESEIAELPEGERVEYAKELGIESSGLDNFIKICHRMLNLITFYTINENEARAWSIERGQKSTDAAGKVHSDMKKGFIKAEVINCKELLELGSIHKAKEEGKLRIEGKDYVVQDGDVIQIRFSV